MRRTIHAAAVVWLVSLVFLVAGNGVRAAVDSSRDVEAAGGFSLVPPDGWTAKEFSGMKYKIIAGPAADQFAPNINVVDEKYDGDLNSYVDQNVSMMKKVFKELKIVRQGDFNTANGMHGKGLVAEDEQQGLRLRQTFFSSPMASENTSSPVPR